MIEGVWVDGKPPYAAVALAPAHDPQNAPAPLSTAGGTTQGVGAPMSTSQPNPNAKVLICAFDDGTPDFRGGARSHAPDCKWAAGNPKSNYVQVTASEVPARVPRCSHCGGGR